jgi:hypothetical protein
MVMKKIKTDQNGFIPMIITLLVIIVAVIVFAYLRVSHAQH